MQLEINGKTYSFKFGIKFIRELDKRMPLEAEGLKLGMGLATRVIPELKSGNVATLSDILYLANRTEKEKISQDDLDDYIDDVEDIEALFDDVHKELGESNAGKLAIGKLEKSMKKQK